MLRCLSLTIAALLLSAPVSAQGTARRILVVPFENASDEPRYHWLTEAAAVLLTDGMRARGAGAIPRGERVRAFERLHLPATGSISRATVIKVGQLVGAGEVIVGSFEVDGVRLTVRAHGIKVEAGRLQPEVRERGDLTDLFAIFDRLARRFAPDGRAEGPDPATPLEAFENYVKGLVAESPAAQREFLKAAIEEHLSFDRARLALWGVYRETGEHAAALEVVEPVPAESRLGGRARFASGVSLLDLGRYEEAFTRFKALLDAGPPSPAAHAAVLNNLGVVLIRRGAAPHMGTPAYYLTKAADLESDPDHMFNLGYAYALAGNTEGAQYWLREVVRREPGDAEAHFVLAAALQAAGSVVEAGRERDLARQLSARYEEPGKNGGESIPSGLERVAVEFDVPRDLRMDRVLVSSAQREQRELARFHLETGRRFFEREQDREAMAELRRAVYLSPYESEAHLIIGRIHLRGGRFGDAIDALKISIWSEETSAARVALGDAYLKSGNPAAARTEAERALALDPESAEAKRLLTEIR